MIKGSANESPRDHCALARAFDHLALALVLLTVAAVIRAPLRIHHDPANMLMAPLRWAEGRAHLEDVAGMNLPLMLYFYGVPAAISHSLATHPVPVFSAFTLLVLCASVAACRGLLGRGAPGTVGPRSFLALVVAGLGLETLEGGELTFGQREVFFLALVLPFLLVRWRRAEGSPPGWTTSALVGVVGAIGALLKPQLLIAVATAELALWFLQGRPRNVLAPENLAFGATGLLYAAHFLLLPAEVIGAFASAVAGAAGGYRAYDAPFLGLLLRFAVPPAVLVAMAGFAAGKEKGSDPFSRLAAVFAGFTAGGLAVYFLQHKGFSYHLVPTVAGTALSGAALVSGHAAARLREVASRRARLLGRPIRAFARAAPLLAIAACIVATSHLPEALDPAPLTPFEEFLSDATSPREEILGITTSVGPLYPALLRMDRRPFRKWVGPFMEIAFFRAGDPREGPPRYPTRARMVPAERRILDTLERDLLTAPPRLVIVAAEQGNQGLPVRFDLVEYLRVAGFLSKALAGFERVQDRAGFAVFRLRTPKSLPADAVSGANNDAVGREATTELRSCSVPPAGIWGVTARGTSVRVRPARSLRYGVGIARRDGHRRSGGTIAPAK